VGVPHFGQGRYQQNAMLLEPVTVKRWRLVVLAAVFISFAVCIDFAFAMLRAKSAPDYLLFADGLVSWSIRSAVRSDPTAAARPGEAPDASTTCHPLVSPVTWQSEIGSVGRTVKWAYAPFLGSSLEISFALPRTGHNDAIAAHIGNAFGGTANSFGDAGTFVRGLVAGKTPQLRTVHCPAYDLLTITKGY